MKSNHLLTTFIKYTSLNITGMIALSCYILADTFFVSKGLGMAGIAALNLAIPVYSFIHGCGLMFGMGGATRYALLKSQKDDKGASAVFTNAMWMTVVLGISIFAIGLFFSDDITRMLGADQKVFAMTRTYLHTILLFAPMFLLNQLFICFVRNDGNPKLSMLAMIGGSLSNIVFDYIFIFPLQMGMFGAVLATGLAPVISMLILSPHVLKKKHQFHLIKQVRSFRTCNIISSMGLPSLITEFSSGIVIILFNTLILKLQGNTGVAAYGIIANLSLVVVATYTGLAQGIQPIISKYAGQKNEIHVQHILRYACCALLLISILVYGTIYIAGDQIITSFNSEHNAILQDIALQGLRIYFLVCPFVGFNIVLSTYFTSIGVSKPAHIISLLRGFIIIIPLSLLLSTLFEMNGIWFTFPICEGIGTIIGVYLFIKSRKKKSRRNLSVEDS